MSSGWLPGRWYQAKRSSGQSLTSGRAQRRPDITSSGQLPTLLPTPDCADGEAWSETNRNPGQTITPSPSRVDAHTSGIASSGQLHRSGIESVEQQPTSGSTVDEIRESELCPVAHFELRLMMKSAIKQIKALDSCPLRCQLLTVWSSRALD